MKLRTRHNSIRLRLTQREVALFLEEGVIAEQIDFGFPPGQSFRYEVRTSSDAIGMSARFENGCVSVLVPMAQARNWSLSDQVGIEGLQSIGDGTNLAILIEKDWACLKPRVGEDESDNYVHPLASTAMC